MGVLHNNTIFDHATTLVEKCKCLSQLYQVHAFLTISGVSNSDPFALKFLSNPATCNNIDYAYRFLKHIKNPTLFHYNAVIRGFANSKTPIQSIYLFVHMLRNHFLPDYMTYPFLVKASSRIIDSKLGGCVHGHVLRNGFASDLFIANSLIHMYGSFRKKEYARKVFDEMPVKNLVSWNSMLDGYAKCGDLMSTKEVFDVMPERNVVSWSALIDGYVKNGYYKKGLEVFEEMRRCGERSNEVTMVSLLCACSQLGALEQGKTMHCYIVDKALPLTLVLRTSLVDMYAKCGAIDEALVVFRGSSLRKTDVLMWNAMIGGLATHGFTTVAMGIYQEMQNLGIKPDEITYLCLLTACAHGGLVNEAWEYFNAITENGMVPKVEHYACMIDALARAGRLTDAYRFVCNMVVEPNASMLGALFNGCINHRNMVLAELVGRRLIKLDPDHDGRYIGLSNVYAVTKHWNKARSLREEMELRGVKKLPGYSHVEVFGEVHRFVAHGKGHPELEEIYFMLSVIREHMKLRPDMEKLEFINSYLV